MIEKTIPVDIVQHYDDKGNFIEQELIFGEHVGICDENGDRVDLPGLGLTDDDLNYPVPDEAYLTPLQYEMAVISVLETLFPHGEIDRTIIADAFHDHDLSVGDAVVFYLERLREYGKSYENRTKDLK